MPKRVYQPVEYTASDPEALKRYAALTSPASQEGDRWDIMGNSTSEDPRVRARDNAVSQMMQLHLRLNKYRSTNPELFNPYPGEIDQSIKGGLTMEQAVKKNRPQSRLADIIQGVHGSPEGVDVDRIRNQISHWQGIAQDMHGGDKRAYAQSMSAFQHHWNRTMDARASYRKAAKGRNTSIINETFPPQEAERGKVGGK